MLSRPPRFFTEGYVIPDENGCWGTEGAKLKPDAPQWAKDEFEEWQKARRKAKENNEKF